MDWLWQFHPHPYSIKVLQIDLSTLSLVGRFSTNWALGPNCSRFLWRQLDFGQTVTVQSVNTKWGTSFQNSWHSWSVTVCGFGEFTKQESVVTTCLPILRTEQRVQRAFCQVLKFITFVFSWHAMLKQCVYCHNHATVSQNTKRLMYRSKLCP